MEDLLLRSVAGAMSHHRIMSPSDFQLLLYLMLEGVIRLLQSGVLRVRQDVGRVGGSWHIASEAVALETVHYKFKNETGSAAGLTLRYQ